MTFTWYASLGEAGVRPAGGTLDVVARFGGEVRQAGGTEAVVAAEELGLVALFVIHLETDVAGEHVRVFTRRQPLAWGAGGRRHHAARTQAAKLPNMKRGLVNLHKEIASFTYCPD